MNHKMYKNINSKYLFFTLFIFLLVINSLNTQASFETTILSPLNNTISGSENVTFIYNTSFKDIKTIKNCSINILSQNNTYYQVVNTTSVLNNTPYIDNNKLKEGKYYWNVSCEGVSYSNKNIINYTKTNTLYVDTTAPSVSFNYPLNHSNISNNINVSISIIDKMNNLNISNRSMHYLNISNLTDTYSYDLIVDPFNHSKYYSSINLIGFKDGNYTFKVTAKDFFNHTTKLSENITIDNTKPFINISMPFNNSNFSSENIPFKTEIYDLFSGLNEVSFIINNLNSNFYKILNYTKSNNYFYSDINTSLYQEGKYTFNVKGKDYSNNTQNSNISFTIDKTRPVLKNAIYPSFSYNNDTVNLSITVEDGISGIKEVSLNGSWINNTLTQSLFRINNNTYSYILKPSFLNNGNNITFRWSAIDYSNNKINGPIFYFKVMNRKPYLKTQLPTLDITEDQISYYKLQLNNYFEDDDNDHLEYNVIVDCSKGNGITARIDNATGNLDISFSHNWNGFGDIKIQAIDSQGESSLNYTMHIIVRDDGNEAPFLKSSVNNIVFEEDNSTTFGLICDPIDPNQICYKYGFDESYSNYNKEVIVDINNKTGFIKLSTKPNWNGITYIRFYAEDNGTPSMRSDLVIKVNVTPINDIPSQVQLLNPTNNSKIINKYNNHSIILKWNYSLDPEGKPINYFVYVNKTLLGTTNNTEFSFQVNNNSSLEWYVVANDGTYNSTPSKKFTFNVSFKNNISNKQPLLIKPIQNISINEDSTYNINLSNYFNDPENDTLDFKCYTSNNNLNVIINKSIVTLSPKINWNGLLSMNCSAEDKFNKTVSNNFEVKVIPVNDAPIIYNPGTQDAKINVPFETQIFASDIDNDTLNYYIINNHPPNMSINKQGVISGWTPSKSEDGINYTITVEVCDSVSCNSTSFNIKVSNDAIYNIEAPNQITISDVELNSSSNISFTIKNKGNFILNNISIIMSGNLLNYNSHITPSNIINLKPNEEKTIVLKINIPDSENLNTHQIGSISIKTSNYTPEIVNVFLNPKSFLDIEKLKVRVGGRKDEVYDGETISKEAQPGDDVEFNIDIRNNYDFDLENVEVTIEIEDFDDGDDVEKDTSSVDIDTGDKEDFKLKFKVPMIIDDKKYEVLIHVEGEDEDDKIYDEYWTVYLEVKKDKHNVIFNRVSLSPNNLKCIKSSNIEASIINIGRKDEDNLLLKITNEDLDINYERNFELESGDDDETKRVISYSFDVDKNIIGQFPILVELYREGNLEKSEILPLYVNKCTSEYSSRTYHKKDNKDASNFKIIKTAPNSSVEYNTNDENLNFEELTIPVLGVLVAAAGVFVIAMIPK